MKNYIEFEEFKKELLKDPETKKSYDALEEEYSLIAAVIQKRIEKDMTQADLARKMGTKQSAISRLESGKCNPSFNFLKRVAKAFDSKVKIEFV